MRLLSRALAYPGAGPRERQVWGHSSVSATRSTEVCFSSASGWSKVPIGHISPTRAAPVKRSNRLPPLPRFPASPHYTRNDFGRSRNSGEIGRAQSPGIRQTGARLR